MVGALSARRVVQYWGLGITLILSSLLGGIAYLLIPLGLVVFPLGIVILWKVLFDVQLPLYNVASVSLRQAVTPYHLLGCINAAMTTISFGVLGLGAFVGGALVAQFGLTWTLLLGGVLTLLGTSPLFVKSVRTLKEPQMVKRASRYGQTGSDLTRLKVLISLGA